MTKVIFLFPKCSPLFKAVIEALIILVKIQFSWLPVNFYNENLLRSIAKNVGEVLKILSTLHVTYAMAVSVTIEVDLRN